MLFYFTVFGGGPSVTVSLMPSDGFAASLGTGAFTDNAIVRQSATCTKNPLIWKDGFLLLDLVARTLW